MTKLLKFIGWKKPISGRWDKGEILYDIKVVSIATVVVIGIVYLF